MDQSPLLTPADAAAFLKMSPRTLETWRRLGKGPKSHRIGHRTIRYVRADLENWLEAPSQATPSPSH